MLLNGFLDPAQCQMSICQISQQKWLEQVQISSRPHTQNILISERPVDFTMGSSSQKEFQINEQMGLGSLRGTCVMCLVPRYTKCHSHDRLWLCRCYILYITSIGIQYVRRPVCIKYQSSQEKYARMIVVGNASVSF